MSLWNKLSRWFDPGDPTGPDSDLRCTPRFVTRLVVSFDGESGALETHGNVGLGGFCFESDREPDEGQRVDLLVDLNGEGEFLLVRGEVLGLVRRGRRLGVRGRFLHIAFEDERRLARWLDARSLAA